MIDLPSTTNTPLVRTNYRDDAAWRELILQVRTPSEDGFMANVEIVDDLTIAGIDIADLKGHFSNDNVLLIVADDRAISDPIHPLLCIDLDTDASLRVIPSELWSIENNIALGNMDFEEFASILGDDGVFRGFG